MSQLELDELANEVGIQNQQQLAKNIRRSSSNFSSRSSSGNNNNLRRNNSHRNTSFADATNIYNTTENSIGRDSPMINLNDDNNNNNQHQQGSLFGDRYRSSNLFHNSSMNSSTTNTTNQRISMTTNQNYGNHNDQLIELRSPSTSAKYPNNNEEHQNSNNNFDYGSPTAKQQQQQQQQLQRDSRTCSSFCSNIFTISNVPFFYALYLCTLDKTISETKLDRVRKGFAVSGFAAAIFMSIFVILFGVFIVQDEKLMGMSPNLKSAAVATLVLACGRVAILSLNFLYTLISKKAGEVSTMLIVVFLFIVNALMIFVPESTTAVPMIGLMFMTTALHLRHRIFVMFACVCLALVSVINESLPHSDQVAFAQYPFNGLVQSNNNNNNLIGVTPPPISPFPPTSPAATSPSSSSSSNVLLFSSYDAIQNNFWALSLLRYSTDLIILLWMTFASYKIFGNVFSKSLAPTSSWKNPSSFHSNNTQHNHHHFNKGKNGNSYYGGGSDASVDYSDDYNGITMSGHQNKNNNNNNNGNTPPTSIDLKVLAALSLREIEHLQASIRDGKILNKNNTIVGGGEANNNMNNIRSTNDLESSINDNATNNNNNLLMLMSTGNGSITNRDGLITLMNNNTNNEQQQPQQQVTLNASHPQIIQNNSSGGGTGDYSTMNNNNNANSINSAQTLPVTSAQVPLSNNVNYPGLDSRFLNLTDNRKICIGVFSIMEVVSSLLNNTITANGNQKIGTQYANSSINELQLKLSNNNNNSNNINNSVANAALRRAMLVNLNNIYNNSTMSNQPQTQQQQQLQQQLQQTGVTPSSPLKTSNDRRKSVVMFNESTKGQQNQEGGISNNVVTLEKSFDGGNNNNSQINSTSPLPSNSPNTTAVISAFNAASSLYSQAAQSTAASNSMFSSSRRNIYSPVLNTSSEGAALFFDEICRIFAETDGFVHSFFGGQVIVSWNAMFPVTPGKFVPLNTNTNIGTFDNSNNINVNNNSATASPSQQQQQQKPPSLTPPRDRGLTASAYSSSIHNDMRRSRAASMAASNRMKTLPPSQQQQQQQLLCSMQEDSALVDAPEIAAAECVRRLRLHRVDNKMRRQLVCTGAVQAGTANCMKLRASHINRSGQRFGIVPVAVAASSFAGNSPSTLGAVPSGGAVSNATPTTTASGQNQQQQQQHQKSMISPQSLPIAILTNGNGNQNFMNSNNMNYNGSITGGNASFTQNASINNRHNMRSPSTNNISIGAPAGGGNNNNNNNGLATSMQSNSQSLPSFYVDPYLLDSCFASWISLVHLMSQRASTLGLTVVGPTIAQKANKFMNIFPVDAFVPGNSSSSSSSSNNSVAVPQPSPFGFGGVYTNNSGEEGMNNNNNNNLTGTQNNLNNVPAVDQTTVTAKDRFLSRLNLVNNNNNNTNNNTNNTSTYNNTPGLINLHRSTSFGAPGQNILQQQQQQQQGNEGSTSGAGADPIVVVARSNILSNNNNSNNFVPASAVDAPFNISRHSIGAVVAGTGKETGNTGPMSYLPTNFSSNAIPNNNNNNNNNNMPRTINTSPNQQFYSSQNGNINNNNYNYMNTNIINPPSIPDVLNPKSILLYSVLDYKNFLVAPASTVVGGVTSPLASTNITTKGGNVPTNNSNNLPPQFRNSVDDGKYVIPGSWYVPPATTTTVPTKSPNRNQEKVTSTASAVAVITTTPPLSSLQNKNGSNSNGFGKSATTSAAQNPTDAFVAVAVMSSPGLLSTSVALNYSNNAEDAELQLQQQQQNQYNHHQQEQIINSPTNVAVAAISSHNNMNNDNSTSANNNNQHLQQPTPSSFGACREGSSQGQIDDINARRSGSQRNNNNINNINHNTHQSSSASVAATTTNSPQHPQNQQVSTPSVSYYYLPSSPPLLLRRDQQLQQSASVVSISKACDEAQKLIDVIASTFYSNNNNNNNNNANAQLNVLETIEQHFRIIISCHLLPDEERDFFQFNLIDAISSNIYQRKLYHMYSLSSLGGNQNQMQQFQQPPPHQIFRSASSVMIAQNNGTSPAEMKASDFLQVNPPGTEKQNHNQIIVGSGIKPRTPEEDNDENENNNNNNFHRPETRNNNNNNNGDDDDDDDRDGDGNRSKMNISSENSSKVSGNNNNPFLSGNNFIEVNNAVAGTLPPPSGDLKHRQGVKRRGTNAPPPLLQASSNQNHNQQQEDENANSNENNVVDSIIIGTGEETETIKKLRADVANAVFTHHHQQQQQRVGIESEEVVPYSSTLGDDENNNNNNNNNNGQQSQQQVQVPNNFSYHSTNVFPAVGLTSGVGEPTVSSTSPEQTQRMTSLLVGPNQTYTTTTTPEASSMKNGIGNNNNNNNPNIINNIFLNTNNVNNSNVSNISSSSPMPARGAVGQKNINNNNDDNNNTQLQPSSEVSKQNVAKSSTSTAPPSLSGTTNIVNNNNNQHNNSGKNSARVMIEMNDSNDKYNSSPLNTTSGNNNNSNNTESVQHGRRKSTVGGNKSGGSDVKK